MFLQVARERKPLSYRVSRRPVRRSLDQKSTDTTIPTAKPIPAPTRPAAQNTSMPPELFHSYRITAPRTNPPPVETKTRRRTTEGSDGMGHGPRVSFGESRPADQSDAYLERHAIAVIPVGNGAFGAGRRHTGTGELVEERHAVMSECYSMSLERESEGSRGLERVSPVHG